jgi:hypothetical protein
MTRTLFYPCCGADIGPALRGFAHRVDAVHASDLVAPAESIRCLRPQWELSPVRTIKHEFKVELEPNGFSGIRNLSERPKAIPSGTRHEFIATERSSRRELPFTWHEYDAVEALRHIDNISVFFFRRDGPHDGEGSSGVLWLGDLLLRRVVAKLEPGGLIVTDGAHMGGVAEQSALWQAPNSGLRDGTEFHVCGRRFIFDSEFCSSRSPTLVWRCE